MEYNCELHHQPMRQCAPWRCSASCRARTLSLRTSMRPAAGAGCGLSASPSYRLAMKTWLWPPQQHAFPLVLLVVTWSGAPALRVQPTAELAAAVSLFAPWSGGSRGFQSWHSIWLFASKLTTPGAAIARSAVSSATRAPWKGPGMRNHLTARCANPSARRLAVQSKKKKKPHANLVFLRCAAADLDQCADKQATCCS